MFHADTITGVGVFFILLAFLLSTFGWLPEKSRIYFLLNFVGASLAFYGSILIQSVPFAVLEGTWALVALIGLFRKKYGA
ncbi:MAG: hypothetical protein IT260_04165 [Saprospiraceae bacterium]|nr:hypothetical protein [Saprospiraceae bacterium]